MILFSLFAVLLLAALVFTWKPLRARELAAKEPGATPNRVVEYLLTLLWWLGATVAFVMLVTLTILSANHS